MQSLCNFISHIPKNEILGVLSTVAIKRSACQSHTRVSMLGSISSISSAREGEVEAALVDYPSSGPLTNTNISTDNMPKRRNERKNNHPKKVQKFAHEDQFAGVSYYFEDGLRKVKPYVYKFECHAKGRWYGNKLLDIFKKEFRLETPEYYETAIQEGLIKVNRGRANPDKILKSNDYMQSKVHRHEPPVTGQPIQILAETDEYLVINKPASIPVHPCGKYRHNTIVFILGSEYGFKGLHTIHRLDRLTSGLLLFARTLEVSHRLDKYVRDRILEKTYVCKVQGEFPSEPVKCDEPIFIVSHKIGVCRVREDGKACLTKFERLSYDGGTSIVKCYPHTGRMHQIRVHLQYMGFPIINDPLYNNTVWGQHKGKGGNANVSDEELLKDLIDKHDIEINSALEKARIQVLINKKKGDGINPKEEGTVAEEITEQRTNLNASLDGNHSSETNKAGESHIGIAQDASESHFDSCAETSSAKEGHLDSVQDKEAQNDDKDAASNNVVETVDGQMSEAVGEVTDPGQERTEGSSKVNDIDEERSGVSDPVVERTEGSSKVNDIDEKRSDVSDTAGERTEGSSKVSDIDEKRSEVSDPDSEKKEDERTDKLAEHLCRECKNPMPDPEPHEMCIYLHALTYKGPGFEFSAPMPAWAEEHFARTGTTFSS